MIQVLKKRYNYDNEHTFPLLKSRKRYQDFAFGMTNDQSGEDSYNDICRYVMIIRDDVRDIR